MAFNAALLTTLFLAATAMRCPIGTFRTGKTTCQKCLPGTYQDKSNQASCKKCPAHTFTSFSGVISEHLCLECPRDSFSLPGSKSCTKCPKEGIRICGKCSTCPPGTVPDNHSCKCLKCSPSSFSNIANAHECTKCPEGQRATKDRTGCKDVTCPVGMVWVSGGCEKCRAEYLGEYLYFRNASMTKCAKCAPRTTVTNFYEPQENCIKCPPGQFLSDIVPGTGTLEGVPVCLPCAEGRTTKGFGKVLCRRKGAPCPSTMFEDADGDCEICDKHQKYVAKEKRCVDCAPDEVSEGGLVKECRRCGGGRIRYFDECRCPAGKEFKNGKCRDCPAGMYRTEGYPEHCLSCDYYQFSSAGTSECEACPHGTSSRMSGGRKCEKVECPKGFIVPPLFTSRFADDVCISGATGCPKGLIGLGYINGLFRCVDKKGKLVCEKGYIFNGVNDCVRCGEDYRLEKKNGRLRCTPCPRGTISEGGLVRKCKACKNGMVEAGFGQACECPERTILKNGKCQHCPRGSEVVQDPIDGPICAKCRPGTYWERKSRWCLRCPVNKTSGFGATKCIKCPKGTGTYEGGGEVDNLPIGDANCVPL